MPERQDPVAVLQSAHPEVSAESGPEWLAEVGGVIEAIPYRWLYWPEIVQVRGAVFVDLHGAGRDTYDARLASAVESGHPDRGGEAWTALVDSFNYFEVSEIFRRWGGPQASLEDSQLALAELLLEPWRARLAQAAPDRRFRVAVAEPTPELGVCVEVRQTSPALTPPAGW
ncbi:hypothetical protein DN069_25760 [Streptacidiphilus pinicola]|uniref:Uncharacterized protein n=1 Tax=Streptacidiphilus pinicola TaxID=2219663 RepID=A0A2X0IGL2_9ACTN|nr:hypothetical protein [Streptacidiphilus pinicola]RAG82763.1 hypothetical protein DN069_25760 [Streptacidiphilus pinicola]